MIVSVTISAVAILGALLVLFRRTILPTKFFADGQFIQSIALGTNIAPADHSYLVVGLFYRVLGLADAPLLASLLGYVAYVVVLLLAVQNLRRREATLAELVLIGAALLIGAVYIGWYSKDVLVLPIALIALIPSRSRSVDVCLLLAIAAYALGFRQYWAIVAGVFLVLRIATAIRPRISTLLVALPLLAFGLAVALGLALGVAPDHYRSVVNDGRTIADAQSTIAPLLASSALPVQALDIVLTFLTLLVPIPLMLHGGSYYLLIAVALSAMWALVAQRARRTFSNGSDAVADRQLALVLGLVLVQALFEPDYGSALRHLTPLLPVIAAYVVRAGAEPSTRISGAADDQVPVPRRALGEAAMGQTRE